jgi:hypothetical protein
MRESKKGEKTHLPMDSTEVWLEAQKPAPGAGKHRNPPEDSYESWMHKRVETRRGPKAARKKTRQ